MTLQQARSPGEQQLLNWEPLEDEQTFLTLTYPPSAPRRSKGSCEKQQCWNKPLSSAENVAICATCSNIVCDECKGEAHVYKRYTHNLLAHDGVDMCKQCMQNMSYAFAMLKKCTRFSASNKKKAADKIRMLLESINTEE